MKKYNVCILETLEKEIIVTANSKTEAKRMAAEAWANQMLRLDPARDSIGVTFEVDNPSN